MARDNILTGNERFLRTEDIIVSKTDLNGRITYANDVFLKIAGFSEEEVLGKAHSIVRHPDMPRCVFKFLWDTISTGNEVFAYVINRAKNGDHYWVFAHVTPTFDSNNNIISYHSNRRAPEKSAIEKIQPLYANLLQIEKSHPDRKAGMEASFSELVNILKGVNLSYEEFIFQV